MPPCQRKTKAITALYALDTRLARRNQFRNAVMATAVSWGGEVQGESDLVRRAATERWIPPGSRGW